MWNKVATNEIVQIGGSELSYKDALVNLVSTYMLHVF
jgi:hypothetical protein